MRVQEIDPADDGDQLLDEHLARCSAERLLNPAGATEVVTGGNGTVLTSRPRTPFAARHAADEVVRIAAEMT